MGTLATGTYAGILLNKLFDPTGQSREPLMSSDTISDGPPGLVSSTSSEDDAAPFPAQEESQRSDQTIAPPVLSHQAGRRQLCNLEKKFFVKIDVFFLSWIFMPRCVDCHNGSWY